ncbi:MAG TPA: hypothetical protein VJM48_03920 [Methylibium sp.]|nr:hypothetical protein [Methylibium sp.]
MRAAPAVQLDVETGACWRVVLWAMACVAIASAVGWALAVSTAVAWAIAVSAAACAGWLGWVGARPRRARLGWDGAGWVLLEQHWREPQRGEVVVALDFGDALLLRFAAAPGTRPRARWIALQRSASMPWHALRCALYSPRPVPAGEAA